MRLTLTAFVVLTPLFVRGSDAPAPAPHADRNVTPKDSARTFPCLRATKPPTIDGKLDEEDWKNAPKQKFVIGWAKNPKDQEPAHGATVRMLWDDDYIYFAGELEDVDIFADVTKHDGDTWTNDCFELFIKPNAANPVYFEFHVTAANVTTDIKYPYPGKKPDAESVGWDSHMKSAVQIDGTLNKRDDTDKGWTVEIRIPWSDFADIAARPKAGERWAFCAGRYDYTGKEPPVNSATALLTQCNFHRVQEYDWIEFVDKAPSGAEQGASEKKEK